jgi:hypothetical protein
MRYGAVKGWPGILVEDITVGEVVREVSQEVELKTLDIHTLKS